MNKEYSLVGMTPSSQFTQDLALTYPFNDRGTQEHHEDHEQGWERNTAPPPVLGESSPIASESYSTQAFSPGHFEAQFSDSTPRVLMPPKVDGVSISPYGGTSGFNSWVEVSTEDTPEGSKPGKLLNPDSN
ncbi:hypothetical protein E0Z10_g4339 [Xylaria hypoxylon]|uniref:Uncharacterized protein n=1 Tax=Xylaria hypoxylon TaxID=37992 RepID=A0A4Z0Z4F2_9PEZI|nr:hypothetical protein E0Z10_g4339 [Xylaria hypoxylon]